MNGAIVLQDEKFELPSGATADCPGTSGVAAEDCNCRCFLTHDIVTDEEFYELTGRHFPEYEEKAEKLFTNDEKQGIIGLKAENGVNISAISEHASERVRERGVSDGDIIDALTDPLNIGDVVLDESGRPSQRFVGNNATVNINPNTGNIITIWKTGTNDRNKYRKEQ